MLPENIQLIGYFDDKSIEHLNLSYFGPYSPHVNSCTEVLVTTGDNKSMENQVNLCRHLIATIKSPLALIDPETIIGEGSVILQQSIIQAGCSIGRHVIINTGVIIDHDSEISDFCHLAPGQLFLRGLK